MDDKIKEAIFTYLDNKIIKEDNVPVEDLKKLWSVEKPTELIEEWSQKRKLNILIAYEDNNPFVIYKKKW
tara:strand:+ start:12596 stop:12805 length:210 start_codon:yes stop_codon:yes gene_type:complete